MENVNDVAAAILDQVGPVETMKLQKLVYYCQAWSLAITDRPMYPDQSLGFKDGPVVDSLYQTHKRRYQVSSWHDGAAHNLTDGARRLIGAVCSTYGSLSGDDLSKLTHTELPWLEAREGLAESAPGRTPLSHVTMARYYRRHGKLGSRTAADLASGGVFMVKAMTPDQIDDLRAELDTLAAEYSSPSTFHPGDDYVGRGQSDRADLQVLSRPAGTRTRMRP